MAEKASAGEGTRLGGPAIHCTHMETAGTLAVGMMTGLSGMCTPWRRSLGPPDDLQATVAAHVAVGAIPKKGDADVLRAAIRAHYAPIRERMTRRLPPRA